MAQPIMSSGGNIIMRHRSHTHGPVPALREGRSPSPSSAEGAEGVDDNPFAPPAKDAPERPWQPRRYGGEPAESAGSGGSRGSGESGESGESGAGGSGSGGTEQSDPPPPRGDRWSSNQPEPDRGGPSGFGGPGLRGPAQGRPGFGPRFDPSDPAQRHARYALLSGMWGLFFGLFSMPQIGLLLGVLAIYWGISSLRTKQKPAEASRQQVLAAFRSPSAAPAPASSSYGSIQARPQFTAAVSGIITGVVTLSVVAMTFSFQLAYKNYYSCVEDALTQPARVACNDLLPAQLRPVLGVRN